jgi:uncharacterized protein YceH (UPF0502 family)
MTDFVSVFSSDSSNGSLHASDQGGDRHPLRILLIGSERDVQETIKNLHRRGFAEATLWSRIMAYPNREAVDYLLPIRSDSVVSILTKYLTH